MRKLLAKVLAWFVGPPSPKDDGHKLVGRRELGVLGAGLATVVTTPYRVAAGGPPLLSMWLYGNQPAIGTPLYFLKSAGNGDGKNGVVNLYNSWRRYMNEGLSESEIRARLTSEAHATFPRGMMEINERVYAEEDRMLAIMGLTSHRTGVGDIQYVRVGTYQGRGGPAKTKGCRYTLVRPDAG